MLPVETCKSCDICLLFESRSFSISFGTLTVLQVFYCTVVNRQIVVKFFIGVQVHSTTAVNGTWSAFMLFCICRDNRGFYEQDIFHVCAICLEIWPKLHTCMPLWVTVFVATRSSTWTSQTWSAWNQRCMRWDSDLMTMTCVNNCKLCTIAVFVFHCASYRPFSDPYCQSQSTCLSVCPEFLKRFFSGN